MRSYGNLIEGRGFYAYTVPLTVGLRLSLRAERGAPRDLKLSFKRFKLGPEAFKVVERAR